MRSWARRASFLVLFFAVTLPALAVGLNLGVGLQAEYFSGTEFETAVLQRVDPVVNFDWPTAGPQDIEAIKGGNLSVRWTGYVQPAFSETYTFHTFSDDGVRLWVNGKQLVNNWTGHGETEDRGQVELEAGRIYELKLEFFQGAGPSAIKLHWSSPSQPQEVIPQRALYPPVFSGKQIAYTDARELRTSTIYLLQAGSEPKKVCQTGEGQPCLTTDGMRLVYTSSQGVNWDDPRVVKSTSINSLEIETGAQRRLTPTTMEAIDPSLSADGKRIVFAAKAGLDYNIWRMNIDGSMQKQLTRGREDDRHPAISADGRYVAYQSLRGEKWNLYLMRADGRGEEVPLTTEEGTVPAFDPSGEKILFISTRDGNPEIYLMNLDGTEQTRITNTPEAESDPVFNLDGKEILYTRTDAAEKSNLYRLRLVANAKAEPVTTTGASYHAAWSR